MSENEKTIAASRRTRRKPKVGGMQRGVDSLIDAPYDLRQDGTTRTVSEAFIDYIRQGEFVETAAGRSGITAECARNWLRTAGKANIRLAVNPKATLTPTEIKCLKFAAAVARAEADFEGISGEQMTQAIRGGARITEVTSERRFRGPNDTVGYLVKRYEKVKTLPPDMRTLQWRLERRFPGRYTPRIQVEQIDGPLTPEEEATALADELETYLKGAADATATDAKAES